MSGFGPREGRESKHISWRAEVRSTAELAGWYDGPMRCWAQILGDCEGRQSREHYLSSAIIGSSEVIVSGLPFLGGEARKIPGDRLVAKMLCELHNRSLSKLDAAAGHFFQVLRAFKYRMMMRARGAKKPGGIDMYDVNGAFVERWMLKTVINLMWGRHLSSSERWSAPRDWVRCAFGVSPFPVRCGLYLLTGEASVSDEEMSSIGLRLLTRPKVDGHELIGGQIRMEDLQFALVMEPLHEKHLSEYRIRSLKDKPSLDLRQIVRFDWSGVATDG